MTGRLERRSAHIPPASPASHRPFWSVMIPTYEGADRIAGTLECVLAQAPGPERMQIDVVDDASRRGDTEAVVREVGGGRVGYFRQPTNVGHSANFNTCIRRARGEVVHILHDDDLVRPGFYARLEPPMCEHPHLGAAFTRSLYADADGHWWALSPLERPSAGVIDDWLFKIARGQRVTTPSMVVRRAAYESVGGFDETVGVGGEDWEMWVRIAARFPTWFEPEPLAIYRSNRAEGLTGATQGTTRLAADMLTMTDVVASYLPDYLPERAGEALERARELYVSWAVEAAISLGRAGQRRDALDAMRLAWRGTTPRVVARLAARQLLEARLSGRLRSQG
jgi:glycosyltransferase involved in cell wall biosynthesis